MGFRGSILIVDDDPVVLESVSELLIRAGYRVTTAPDGVQAVVQAEATRPGLIISDIQMPPWGTGVEALAKMRTIPALASVPVVFITGMPAEEARKLMPPDPRIRLLSKPIDWAQLLSAILELAGEIRPLA